MNWKDEALKLWMAGNNKTEIAKIIQPKYFDELSLENVRRHKVSPYIDNLKNDIELDVKITKENTSFEYKADGSIVSQKFIYLQEGEDLTPQKILESHGLKPSLWQIVSYKNNYWNTQLKGGTKQISYQSKVTAKPIEQGIDFEEIEKYFTEKNFTNIKSPVKCSNYDKDGEILEIDVPDLHAGMLAWRHESGEDYDLKIVKDRFFLFIGDVLERAKNKKIKKIIFATLGDLLHTDNDNQTTTKGTFQQVDGRFAKIFNTTLDMLIDGITMLGDVAPVEVIYCPGNHDKITGFALVKAVEKAFRLDKNVIFDTYPDPQKYRLVGRTLIGFTHGDMPAKNMTGWLQHNARKDFGQSKYAEIHAGHFHSQKTKEYVQTDEKDGFIIRYLPTVAGASAWEHHEGYNSYKTAMCFIWHETMGLRDIWFCNM